MRKIFTKKQNKRLIIIGISTLLIIMSLGILSLVFSHETNRYKPCEEYKFDLYGEENRIKGIDAITGHYIDTSQISCASQVYNDTPSYEKEGLYTETHSCQIGKDNKTFVTTEYKRCPFGCFGGECMEKCESPNSNNIFVKGVSYGINKNAFPMITSLNNDFSLQYDYCTNKKNSQHPLLSKYVAKQTCDSNNFLTPVVTKCENICFDGACQNNNFNYCSDSDYNDQGKIKGTITSYSSINKEIESSEDTCLDSKTVTEYFCGADKKSHKLILTCRKKCSEGACL